MKFSGVKIKYKDDEGIEEEDEIDPLLELKICEDTVNIWNGFHTYSYLIKNIISFEIV